MTNKDFVKSLYPNAYVKKYYCHGYMILNIKDGIFWSTTANTANESWSLAAQIINEKILSKLEN